MTEAHGFADLRVQMAILEELANCEPKLVIEVERSAVLTSMSKRSDRLSTDRSTSCDCVGVKPEFSLHREARDYLLMRCRGRGLRNK